MDRRHFLKVSAATGAGALAASTLPRQVLRAAALPDGPFQYGVASGDPRSHRLILWTRLTPTDAATPGSRRGAPTDVVWEMATDPRFRDVARQGRVTTAPATDHVVKLDVAGLKPDTEYYYRFRSKGVTSPVGQTKTSPGGGGLTPSIRFGVASCSNYEGGFFSAYRHLAARDDLDFVLHLGDYIYEYGAGVYGPGPEIGRVHDPKTEMVSLEDYRRRHAQYKADPDLQGLHGKVPFIPVWDDHEVTNDTYRNGAENHQPEEEGEFSVRRRRAYRAYFEWMPIRLPRPEKDPSRIYRGFKFGDLVDLHMLDTRQYRDRQSAENKDAPERTLTGDPQMGWLKQGLADSGTPWHLVGNQVMITPVETGEDRPFNVDSWDGYTADRQELLEHLQETKTDNVVFVTGDIHTSWACDVPIDATTYPATPSVATELVGTSITSDNLNEITGSPPRTTSVAVENGLKADNPYIKYVELDSHGYSVVDVTAERLQMDWYYISDRTDKDASQAFGAAWQVAAGTNSVAPATEPIPEGRP